MDDEIFGCGSGVVVVDLWVDLIGGRYLDLAEWVKHFFCIYDHKNAYHLCLLFLLFGDVVLRWGISRRTTWSVVRVRCGSWGCVSLGRVSRDAALLVIFCALSIIPATTPTVVGRVQFSSSSARVNSTCHPQRTVVPSHPRVPSRRPLPMATAPLPKKNKQVRRINSRHRTIFESSAGKSGHVK